MIPTGIEADAVAWAWCTLFHRKHHEHLGRYRECHKCGSWVISRDWKRERARKRELEQRQFETNRAAVRAMFEPSSSLGTLKKWHEAYPVDKQLICPICHEPKVTHGCRPEVNACMNSRDWPEIIE